MMVAHLPRTRVLSACVCGGLQLIFLFRCVSFVSPPQEQQEEPEDESLKKQEEHYLRELRICLREVSGRGKSIVCGSH